MSEHFRPYEGDRPYLFVSYAHRDSDLVVPVIRRLHDRLWRVWYDEGIPAGSDWSLNIERHLRGCAAVLLFLSESALASPNCTGEARTAAELGKPVICVPLDGCVPEEPWRTYLAGASMVRTEASAAGADGGHGARAWADAITADPLLTDDFLGTPEERRQDVAGAGRRSPWVVAAALAAVLLAGALGGLGWVLWAQPGAVQEDVPPQDEPATIAQPVDLSQYGDLFASYVSFPDAQQERAVRSVTGVRTGRVPAERLLDISELYFCGNLTPASLDAVAFDDTGTCLVNGVPAREGQVRDLSLVATMPYLRRLALICQPVAEVDALASLAQLEELSLAGSPVKDLAPLASLPSLRVLHLEHGAARDLTSLAGAPALQRVTVSIDMLPLVLDPDASYDVVLVR